MAKSKSFYECSNCGGQSAGWSGKCPHCGAWNTLEEKLDIDSVVKGIKTRQLDITDVSDSLKTSQSRIKSTIKDLGNVLGGGLVPGSLILLAGQPGMGKSTLLLQLASDIAKTKGVLYISGEESMSQLANRSERLKLPHNKLKIASSNTAEDIESAIADGEFSLVIIDSIQSTVCQSISSSPGTVSQITNSTNLINHAAKASGAAVIVVGHVTKEGNIAGPKTLEHLVDVVIELEGDRYGGFKVLRATKNRFGSINQTGIFEMTNLGMSAVPNPSAALLKERQITDGSIVHATMEGSRPLLVEIQALVNNTSYGYPKRTASGFDLNRLNLLIAVLEKRTKLNLASKDIYINTVGGISLKEPAADLAVCMAIASAASGLKLKSDLVVYGEVGLSGEVRHVPFSEKRLEEAVKLGFKGAIGPYTSKKESKLTPVKNVRQALIEFLGKD
jgi:DNA repair protein RadA/Sms